jgi:hypothetical protein
VELVLLIKILLQPLVAILLVLHIPQQAAAIVVGTQQVVLVVLVQVQDQAKQQEAETLVLIHQLKVMLVELVLQMALLEMVQVVAVEQQQLVTLH